MSYRRNSGGKFSRGRNGKYSGDQQQKRHRSMPVVVVVFIDALVAGLILLVFDHGEEAAGCAEQSDPAPDVCCRDRTGNSCTDGSAD